MSARSFDARICWFKWLLKSCIYLNLILNKLKKLKNHLAVDPLHQIYCALHSFVLNDFQRCESHLKKFDALDASKINLALTTKEKKFCRNYNRFLNLLISNPEKHDQFLSRKAYHIGESHCLSYAHSRIEINSQDYIVYPKIVFARETYHFFVKIIIIGLKN